MENIFNIYCDESRVENNEYSKMVIGAVLLQRSEKENIVDKIKEIYKKYNFSYELKWIKTSEKNIPFYKELLDYFVSEDLLQFRCIIVDKTKVDYEKFHNNDAELAFFRFYYLMLKARLLDNKKYYIFLDKKPTRDKNRARALLSFLNSYVLLNKKECSIEHLQAYDSDENLMIQLADYLTGLVSHNCNRGIDGSAKGVIIQYLKTKLEKKDLCVTTASSEIKFNVLAWRPNSTTV